MKIEFNKITIQGFRSFSNKQTFILKRNSGLYYITGENEAEKELGGNGTGKSSVFESIVFCLFNKISTNLSAGSIANWNSKLPCEVELFLIIDNVEYIIKRTWKPNTLLINNEITTQEKLEELIKYNYTTFLFHIFIAQFSSKFFDLTPAEKLSVFDNIMNDKLEKWARYSEICNTKSTKISAMLSNAHRSLSNLEGRISMLSISYDEDIESFNDKLLNERNKLIEEKMDLINSIKKFNMVDNSTLIDDYEEKIQKLEVGQIRSIEAVIKEKENFIRKIANDIYNLRKDISRYEKDISFYETNDSCSICKQDITLNFRKNKIKEIKKEIKKLKEEEYALADQEKRYSREIGNYSTGLEESKRLQKSYILQQGELKREQSININSKKHLTAALENINIKITELESGDNPFIEKENKRKKMLSILNRKKEHLEAEIEELTESKNGYDFWSVGFKKIKLLVIEEALVELEMSINNAISDLGMSNWAIRLSIESNTKKDTIKSGFTVMVKSPHNKDLVPFTAWSGGESQRLRLAGQIGIIDFISNYKGIDASFEAWDEPSAWLSSEGIDSLISLLNNRAKDLNKVIYFIDHKQLSVDGNFADIINIKKTKGGTICE